MPTVLFVGPFAASGIVGGVFALTDCDTLAFGEIEFRDETVLPGRIRFKIAGVEYDVMEKVVLVDGVEHTWEPTHLPLDGIAVGTAVIGGPPHRSEREELQSYGSCLERVKGKQTRKASEDEPGAG